MYPVKPLFATPCYNGLVTRAYADAMVDIAVNLTELTIAFRTYTLGGESVVDRARNECVAEFLSDPTFTHLFFIDADNVPSAQVVYDMLTADVDVLVAPYRKKNQEELWTVRLPAERVMLPHPRLVPMTVCLEGGTGCMVLSRRAIAELCLGLETYTGGVSGKPRPCHNLFQTPIRDGLRIGEDQYLCRRWRAMGQTVGCLVTSDVGHVAWDGTVLYGNFEAAHGFPLPGSGKNDVQAISSILGKRWQRSVLDI